MRKFLYAFAALILASFVAALPAGSAPAEKRVALVIGNAAYQYATPLANTLKDAKAIAAMLANAGFDVVESRTDLGVVDFKRTLRDFVQTARDADIAVVYYAGHGIEVRGSNYLIPVDAKLASDFDADDEAVTLERIVLAVEPVKQLRLIILDACRDNPFLRKMQRAIAQRAVTTGLAPVEPTAGNTLVAYAAKAGSISFDGTGSNSPFTTALIKHLAEPGLDVRIALGRVRDEVIRSTASRQEPFIYGSLGGATIPLVPAPAKPAASEAVAGGSYQQIQVDYEFAERVGNRSAWEAFLATHPAGYYANLARAQLAKLNQSTSVPTATSTRRAPADGEATPPKPAARPKEQQQARLDLSPRPDRGRESVAPPKDDADAAVDPCKRDEERLAKLRANPVAEEIIALERGLGCPRLRLQVVRLRESVVGDLPPSSTPPSSTPPAATPPQQAAIAPPAPPKPAPVSAEERCKQDHDKLVQLRANPTHDDVLRFERDLGCERLRAQVLRLKESIAD